MKTKLFLLCYAAILFLLNGVIAQEIPKDITERVLFCNYIFEGEVIRSNAYWSSDKKNILTSSTIEIYKLLKTDSTSDFTCGTVEVISEGGTINDTTLKISHNLELRKGMKGIFLCNETQKELPAEDYYSESNSIKLDIPYGLE